MGWTEYHAKFYKKGRVDRKAECDNLFDDSSYKVLKSAMVGSTYYAAIENTTAKTKTVFAIVCLTSTNNRNYYNFAYKDMDETMGPNEAKCPISILKLLTDTNYEYAQNWRQRCWEYHEGKKGKIPLGKLKAGSVVKFSVNGEIYKATKEFGCVVIKNNKISSIRTYWELNHKYLKASSRVINSWGYEIIHKATASEEKEAREKRLSDPYLQKYL